MLMAICCAGELVTNNVEETEEEVAQTTDGTFLVVVVVACFFFCLIVSQIPNAHKTNATRKQQKMLRVIRSNKLGQLQKLSTHLYPIIGNMSRTLLSTPSCR